MFFSKNQLEILNLFFSQPRVELHLRELSRILEKKPGTFQKSLNRLEEEGVLKSRIRGNQRLISLNKDYPFLKEIKSIVEKTAGVAPMLKNIFEKFVKIKTALIFGSYVLNRMRSDSDIDVLIVCSKSVQESVLKELNVLEKKLLREINPKFYSPELFLLKKKDPFLCEVLSKKIILLKGDYESVE